MYMTRLLYLVVGLSLCASVWSRDSISLEDEEGMMICKCGESKKEWKKQLDLKIVADIFEHIVDTGVKRTSLVYYPKVIRKYFKKCTSCEIFRTICHGSPDVKKDYFCDKRTAGFIIPKNETIDLEYRDIVKYGLEKIAPEDIENIGHILVVISKGDTKKFPKHVHIPVGGLKMRFKRHMDVCHYPTSLQTAQLDCIHYPSTVKCTQRCAFGFALKGGKKVDYTCRKKENKWKPHNFHECQPYVDCTITLISGGSSQCQAPTLTKGPVCRIKCDKYEDKPPVSSKKYSCNNKGNWEPSLPFCAHAGSGLELIEKPHGSVGRDSRDKSKNYDY